MKALLLVLLIPALGSAQIPSLSDTLTGTLSNGVIHFHWRSTNDLGAKEYAVIQIRPDNTSRYASGFITPKNSNGPEEYTTDVPLDDNVINAAFTGLILVLGLGMLGLGLDESSSFRPWYVWPWWRVARSPSRNRLPQHRGLHRELREPSDSRSYRPTDRSGIIPGWLR